MNFIAVIVFALASGITPTVRWLEMIPIVALFVILATGIGMLLSALYVRFRDVKPIWDVLLQVWFYASPVMYVASRYGQFAKGFQHIAMANPIATLLTWMGHAFIDPASFPSPVTVAGVLPVLIALTTILAIFALGWSVFTREAPLVAENL
jgi:ABC-2 type transport system permease protein